MAGLEGKIIVSNSEMRPCVVDGKKALFHTWENKDIPIIKINAMLTEKALSRIAEKIKNGVIPPNYGSDVTLQKAVLAIVEFEDGTVEEVEPCKIRFLDSPFDQYSFTEREARE